MAQRESPPVEPDEAGEHVPNLDILLPELIADGTDGVAEDFDYPVGEYPIPDLDDQEEDPVES